MFGKDILVGESEERGKKKQDTAEVESLFSV